MICRASVGNAPTLGARLDISTGLSGECVRTGRTLRCDNSENDPRVDAASCRRLGIHSILAAPIRLGGEVVGILEVFSSQRFNFHDGDLAVVEDLAKTVFVVPPAAPKTTLAPPLLTNVPPPKLLLELEPAWRVFFGNLSDLVFPQRVAPLKLTSRPAAFWPDVLVPSEPAWERFHQSLLLHVTMVAMLGLIEFGLSQRPLLRQSRLTVTKSDSVYYLPPEYVRALRGESEPSPPSEQSPAKPRVLAVRRESGRRTQKSIAPPTLHLKDSRFRITTSNPVAPTVPFSATMRNPRRTPATGVAAIAPPPDTSAVSRRQNPTLGTPQAVAPVPSVDPSSSQRANIALGHLEVVGPAPEIPGDAQRSLSGSAKATLDRAGTLVVPPPPSVAGSSRQTASIGLGHQDVVRPAPEIPGDAQRSLAGSAQASLTRGATTVVPPPPSIGRSTHQTSSLSLGHLEVVGPAPQIPGDAQRSLASSAQASLTRGATTVVPPPPLLQIAGSYLIDTPDGGAILVVPPPPSIGGLERRSGHSASSLRGSGTQAVVPPPPSVGGLAGSGGHSASSLGGGGTQAVVPPPPSVGGLAGSGGHPASSLGGGGTQAVVPPPPSVGGGFGGSGGRSLSSQRAAGMPVAQPGIAVQTAVGDRSQGEQSTARASGLPEGALPGEITGNGGDHADSKKAAEANELGSTKDLSISFIGPALAFPQSSYFSNFEVFIAEERLNRHQSRIIKLVYDFLPYQTRLSALGPDYPYLDNLHATRDPSCDEPLKQVVSLAGLLHWPQASLTQLNTTTSKQRQNTLPCYRTTADDYRKALERRR